jgi:short-subunit dehydrogenase
MKKAIVVGATSGIGLAIAQLLTADQYLVGITGRRKDVLEELSTAFPGQYHTKSFDVTDTENIERHLNEIAGKLNGLDLLIICAGTGDINDSLDFKLEKQIIDTNVTGFTSIADWAYRYFKKQGSGHLAAISSVAGLRGSRQAPAYSASKSYQINYLEGLRQKSNKEKSGITVTDIRPGFVDTKMAKSPVKFWVAPVNKAAEEIYSAIKNKRKIAYITRRWRIIAWIVKLMPGNLYTRL